MFKIRLLWQLLYTYLLIIVVTLLAASWYASDYIRRTYLEFVKNDLESVAEFLGKQIENEGITLENANLDDLCQELSEIYDRRLTIILPNGIVVGESDRNSDDMENHATRPEILEAFEGNVGESMRYSESVNKTMQYVAIPYIHDGVITGVIRAAYPASSIAVALRSIYFPIGLGGAVIALIAISISLYFSFQISSPLTVMQNGAARFARGDLNQPIDIRGAQDFEVLANAMNHMAVQLSERIHFEVQNRSQLEAILSSMVEGVIAIDRNRNVISINHTAKKWLEVDDQNMEPQDILMQIKHQDFIGFVNAALKSNQPIEQEFELGTYKVRFVQAQSSTLRDSEGEIDGTVIVMHDVTRVRTLENLRQEFVANVSHELKTPITSIKGFVETLLDGAINNPNDSKRFLSIITKQADRLHAIIEDLLSLSRVEQEEKQGSIPLVKSEVATVLHFAMENCSPRLEEKKIRYSKHIDDSIELEINTQLLEQAVSNLIDNAVKYSDSGSKIEVALYKNEFETIISVQDWGCGIPNEHLPRLFERFYRVDKARSRKMGGTGLGLAIVKHITQAHNGYVDVKSTVGEGSTFTIHLPKSS